MLHKRFSATKVVDTERKRALTGVSVYYARMSNNELLCDTSDEQIKFDFKEAKAIKGKTGPEVWAMIEHRTIATPTEPIRITQAMIDRHVGKVEMDLTPGKLPEVKLTDPIPPIEEVAEPDSMFRTCKKCGAEYDNPDKRVKKCEACRNG